MDPVTPQPNSGDPVAPEPTLLADPPVAADPPADPPKPAEGAPEKYEIKAPEGAEYDATFLETYSDAARELDLTNEKAQAFLDKLAPVVRQQQQARIDAIRNEWTESSKIDKEFGGDQLKPNLAIAKAALEKFGTPELKDLLYKSGLGDHPELIRFFYRAGKAISPDNFVGGHTEGKVGPASYNDYADKLYATQ